MSLVDTLEEIIAQEESERARIAAGLADMADEPPQGLLAPIAAALRGLVGSFDPRTKH